MDPFPEIASALCWHLRWAGKRGCLGALRLLCITPDGPRLRLDGGPGGAPWLAAANGHLEALELLLEGALADEARADPRTYASLLEAALGRGQLHVADALAPRSPRLRAEVFDGLCDAALEGHLEAGRVDEAWVQGACWILEKDAGNTSHGARAKLWTLVGPEGPSRRIERRFPAAVAALAAEQAAEQAAAQAAAQATA